MFFSIIYFYTGAFKLHIKELFHINNICKQLNSADFSVTAHAVCLLNVLTFLRLFTLNIFLINLNLLSFYLAQNKFSHSYYWWFSLFFPPCHQQKKGKSKIDMLLICYIT